MLIAIRKELLDDHIDPNFEEQILDCVEKLGMLPPLALIPNNASYTDAMGAVYYPFPDKKNE